MNLLHKSQKFISVMLFCPFNSFNFFKQKSQVILSFVIGCSKLFLMKYE